jgi:hypothetical protein
MSLKKSLASKSRLKTSFPSEENLDIPRMTKEEWERIKASLPPDAELLSLEEIHELLEADVKGALLIKRLIEEDMAKGEIPKP